MSEDWSAVDMLGADETVLASLEREAYCRAVRRVAASTGGIVTAAQVRVELHRTVEGRTINPHRIGGIVNGFVQRGIFVDTNRMSRSEDRRNRNANRRLPVWRVTDLKAVK